MPITGIALPFVSFGSTALIVAMASLGILVNIAQAGVPPKG
jgi:cell division protein FtsW (lipid II flippase)